jgi:hypothetical protein
VFLKYTSLLSTCPSAALVGELPPVTGQSLVPHLLLSLSCLALFTFGNWVPVQDFSLPLRGKESCARLTINERLD